MINQETKKIALGTVQFGKDYGINNFRGKVPQDEVKQILDYAEQNNIKILDSAAVYGDSETVLGNYLESKPNSFRVVSKVAAEVKTSEELRQMFALSLAKLHLDKIYGYLFHDFSCFKSNPNLFATMADLKSDGRIQKIGFSLYFPEDIDYLFEKKIKFDLVQFPYSVFDQRFERHMQQLKELGVEIHTRSVFLQGLVFKRPSALDKEFKNIENKLVRLNQIASDLNLDIAAVCLNFALANPSIDKVVIGVDSLENLKENIVSAQKTNLVSIRINDLSLLAEKDEQIILPFNWRAK